MNDYIVSNIYIFHLLHTSHSPLGITPALHFFLGGKIPKPLKTKKNTYICNMKIQLKQKTLDYLLEAVMVLTDVILRAGFFGILLGEVMGYDITFIQSVMLGMIANLLLNGKLVDLSGFVKIAKGEK